MLTIVRMCNEVLAAYDVCVEVYSTIGETPSKEQEIALKKAYSTFEDRLNAFVEFLDKEGIPRQESWLISKWYFEDYFHYDDMYICPADLLNDIRALL